MIKIATSILSSNNRIESIKKLNDTSNDYLHMDIMDGNFVPNYQLPIDEVLELAKFSFVPLDVHLMVNDPETYITKLSKLNIDFITIHLEINHNINDLIKLIKSYGFKACLSIKPNTELEKIYPYLNDIDMVLIMSVEPGLGGQKFIPESIDKAIKIKQKRADIIIEMDGGINDTTIELIKSYVDIAVVGSYIINQTDYNKAIKNLKN